MVETGINDKVKVIAIDGDEDITEKLGNIQSFSYTIDNATEHLAGIGNEEKFVDMIDKCIDINGSIEMWVSNLISLRMFGTYNEGEGTIIWDKELPEFNIETNADSDNIIKINNCKFGSVTISLEDQEPISISADWIGLNYDKELGSVDTTISSEKPMQGMDAELQIDGTPIGRVQTASITFDREIEAVRGISSTEEGERRFFTKIIEKMKNISFDMDIIITDDKAWNLVSKEDWRNNVEFKILTKHKHYTGDITITSRAGSLSVDKSADGELRLASISGLGIDVVIDNIKEISEEPEP